MYKEYDSYDLDEDGEYLEYLTHIGHIKEYAEYIKRQERDDRSLYGLDDYLFKTMRGIHQCLVPGSGKTKAEGECKHQGCHHSHQRWNGHREKRSRFICCCNLLHGLPGLNHGRKQSSSGKIRDKSGKNGREICYEHGHKQHLSCLSSDVTDGSRNKSHYYKWNGKSQKLAEYSVECQEYTHAPLGCDEAGSDTKRYCNQNLSQDSDLQFFHGQVLLFLCGYKIFFTSAKNHIGIETLKEYLKGKTIAMCGNSGVGKTSLINNLFPEVDLRTKTISSKTKRGVHTTRHCEIIENNELKIVDTPGFSQVRFDFILPYELSELFDEIKALKNNCKYKDCTHTTEDNCSVLSNLAQIAKTRYESYLEFLKEAKEFKQKVQNEGRKKEFLHKENLDKIITKISAKKRAKSRKTINQNIEIDSSIDI